MLLLPGRELQDGLALACPVDVHALIENLNAAIEYIAPIYIQGDGVERGKLVEPSELQKEGIEGRVAFEAGFGLVGKPDLRGFIA